MLIVLSFERNRTLVLVRHIQKRAWESHGWSKAYLVYFRILTFSYPEALQLKSKHEDTASPELTFFHLVIMPAKGRMLRPPSRDYEFEHPHIALSDPESDWETSTTTSDQGAGEAYHTPVEDRARSVAGLYETEDGAETVQADQRGQDDQKTCRGFGEGVGRTSASWGVFEDGLGRGGGGETVGCVADAAEGEEGEQRGGRCEEEEQCGGIREGGEVEYEGSEWVGDGLAGAGREGERCGSGEDGHGGGEDGVREEDVAEGFDGCAEIDEGAGSGSPRGWAAAAGEVRSGELGQRKLYSIANVSIGLGVGAFEDNESTASGDTSSGNELRRHSSDPTPSSNKQWRLKELLHDKHHKSAKQVSFQKSRSENAADDESVVMHTPPSIARRQFPLKGGILKVKRTPKVLIRLLDGTQQDSYSSTESSASSSASEEEAEIDSGEEASESRIGQHNFDP